MNETILPEKPDLAAGRPDTWGILVGALALGGILLMSLLGPPLQWLVWDISVVSGTPLPAAASLIVSGVETALLLIALGLLGAFWRGSDRYRAVFQTWAAAALFPLFTLPLRLEAPASVSDAAGTAVYWQIGAGVGYLLLLWFLSRSQRLTRPGRASGSLWPAFLLAAPLLALWFRSGALGAWDDLLLDLLAGILFGLAFARLLAIFLLPTLERTGRGPGWNLTLGGIAAGGALAIMAPPLGLFGQTLFFLAVLPALGWAAMVARQLGGGTRAAGWLIGLVAAVIMALADADELNIILLLENGEIFSWLFWPALLTAAGGWLIGGLGLSLAGRLPGLLSPTAGRILAAVLWGGVLLLYFLTGRPGFYGDRLFVILNSQPDVSAAKQIDGIDERRRFVYEQLVAAADERQAPLRADLDRLGVAYRPYYLVNAVEVEGNRLLAWWLRRRPEVDRVIPSYVLRPLPGRPATASGEAARPDTPQWNLTQIGAERVWDAFGVRGAGITIGQSDSGVELTHPELNDSYRGETTGHDYNWFDPWFGSPFPTDTNGHGTHTLGSAAGNTVGVAPDATWFACANLQRPLGNPAVYLDCLQFMLAPWPAGGDPFVDGRPDLAADVLNNSWGCPSLEGCDAPSLEPAVAALRAAGIFVVVSAGNEGLGGCGTIGDPPAIYDQVFSVGAVNERGEVSLFSSRGPVAADGSSRIKPDMVAPGEGVLSAMPNQTYGFNDGTSMAGPHVAGVVALVWSANPALIGQIDETERILQETARPLGRLSDACGRAETPNNVEGYGLIDAFGAVEMALAQEGSK